MRHLQLIVDSMNNSIIELLVSVHLENDQHKNKRSTFLQSKINCSEEEFYCKPHDAMTCDFFWKCVKIKEVHNNCTDYFRENKATKS